MDKITAEYISSIFKALSSKERLVTLENLSKGKMKLMDLAKKAGMSRSGFQSVVNDFRNVRLIEQAEHRSYYRLSLKGKKVLEHIKKLNVELEPIEKEYREEQLEKSISKFGSGLSRKEILEIVEKVGTKVEKDKP